MPVINYRVQNDGKQDEVSANAGIDCSDDPDIVRQEDTRMADLNVLIPRFGGGLIPTERPAIFGEIDFTSDLQRSIQAVREMNDSYNALPTELRARYPTWEHILTALEQGEIRIKPEAERPPTPDATGTPAP